jgi:hypothetical protein
MASLPEALQQQGLGQLTVTLQGMSTFRNQVRAQQNDTTLKVLLANASCDVMHMILPTPCCTRPKGADAQH